MRYRIFPNTDVRVSEVGFGTWTVSTGWWGEKTDAEAVALMRRALDEHGVTFFDAADAYGNGRAERQIAEAFRGRRDEIVIGTKIGYDIYDDAAQKSRRGQQELPMRTDPEFLRSAVERCLERLETDYIDVLQLHNAKMEHVRDAELWGTLRDLKREGKIKTWGAAFGPAIGWLYEAVELVEREPDVNTIQMIWNVLEQHPGSAMIEAARRHAGRAIYRGHRLSRERPPPPSPALLAGERRGEGEDARLPHSGDDAGAGGAQVAARRAARGDYAAERLR
jgi:aryl-alcohol dehydrogenase-like predicted oxidoreductase